MTVHNGCQIRGKRYNKAIFEMIGVPGQEKKMGRLS